MKLKEFFKNTTKTLGALTGFFVTAKCSLSVITNLMEEMTKLLLEMTKFVATVKEFLNLF